MESYTAVKDEYLAKHEANALFHFLNDLRHTKRFVGFSTAEIVVIVRYLADAT